MVADSPALITIALLEPGYERYERAIKDAPVVYVSSAIVFETAVVLLRRYRSVSAFERVDSLVRALGLTVVSFNETDALRARAVYARHGKGVHPARLNLMDCISYALAERMGERLLYVGNDFAQTPLA